MSLQKLNTSLADEKDRLKQKQQEQLLVTNKIQSELEFMMKVDKNLTQ